MPESDPFPVARFESREAFQEELLGSVATAERHVWLADHDFSQWPMNSPAMEASLRNFLLASRANRVQILVADAAYLSDRAPRFMNLFRLFAHAITCRIPAEQVGARFSEECSFAVVDHARVVRRFHRSTMRGVTETEPGSVRPWVDQYQTLWEDATPGLSASILGL